MDPARERAQHGEAPDSATPAAAFAPGGPSPAAYALRLQRAVGNRAATAILRQSQTAGAAAAPRPDDVLPPEMVPFQQTAVSRPHPAYNEGHSGGRDVDPEQARGVLPFTADGWNGQQIAAHMGQLTGTGSRTDAVSCVESSFIAELVVRGPEAVRASIQGYIRRYRDQMTHGASRPLLARLTRSIAVLESVVQSLDMRSMTYQQLGTLQRHMYTAHGNGASGSGTGDLGEAQMAAHEGYTRRALNLRNVSRAQAAAQAATLQPGEYLSCGVDASNRGTGDIGHAIHIRRDANQGLHLYDPWPRRGNQDTPLSADLVEMSEYFEGRTRGGPVVRTFEIIARFTPPAPAPAPAAPRAGP